MKQVKLDFIGLGAPKSATTWIAKCLAEHPEINFSKDKESNFFLNPTKGYGKEFYRSGKPHSIEEYNKLYDLRSENIKGEYGIHYLYDIDSLKRISSLFPNIKTIVSIRNPYELLYSGYRYYRNSFRSDTTPSTFLDAIKSSNGFELYSPTRGQLYKPIKNVMQIFGKGNLHIIQYDQITTNPINVITSLYEYLNIDRNYTPLNLHTFINKTKEIRSKRIGKLSNLIYADNIGSKSAYKLFYMLNKNGRIDTLYSKLMKSDSSRTKIPKDAISYLKPKLNPDIDKLEKLIDMNLSSWKR